MTDALSEKLDIWGFEDGSLIFKDFSVGGILKLKPRDISCSTDEELNSLHGLMCDFLNGLPSGMSLQFVQGIEGTSDLAMENHKNSLVADANPLAGSLVDGRISRLQELNKAGDLPAQALYLIVRRPFQSNPVKRTPKILFWKKSSDADNVTAVALEQEVKSFRQLLVGIQQSLESIGVHSSVVSEADVFKMLFDQWNPEFPLEGVNFNKEDIRDELLLNDLIVSLKGFALGKVHHRVLSLKIMPDQTFASMAEKLRELPFNSKLLLTIDVLDQAKETAALETQRRITYAMYSGKKGVSDLESQAKLRDIESLLARRVTGEEKIFSVALNIVLRDESEEKLESQVQDSLQKIRELSGAEGMVETYAAAPMFLEFSLPNARAKERSRKVNTSVLADFLPIYGDWQGHDVPRVLLRNRRGGLLCFDPFSPTLTNFNQIVSGGSGSGKSFLTNILISQLMKEDPKVFILDIGGSYKKMTENLDGQYVELGASSDLSLNPFDLNDRSEEAIDQKIKFMVSLVELMTKENEASGIGKLERSEIEQILNGMLKSDDEPRLTALRDRLLLDEEPVLQKMGKILGPWCGDSPYGKFVDQKTNLELKKKIVCFDLKGLESHPDLQAVCLFLITDLIWREVQKDRTSIKIVVFDECWRLLESESGSRFMGEVFRTFRKYRASAIAISQTMDDFSRSKVSQAILPNSSIKWILKQTGGNLPALKETLMLNSREIKLVESVTSKKGHFSEAFLIAGDDKNVVVVESTPLEYWLSTTDPMDLKLFDDEKNKNPEFSSVDLLKELAATYPKGRASA